MRILIGYFIVERKQQLSNANGKRADEHQTLSWVITYTESRKWSAFAMCIFHILNKKSSRDILSEDDSFHGSDYSAAQNSRNIKTKEKINEESLKKAWRIFAAYDRQYPLSACHALHEAVPTRLYARKELTVVSFGSNCHTAHSRMSLRPSTLNAKQSKQAREEFTRREWRPNAFGKICTKIMFV